MKATALLLILTLIFGCGNVERPRAAVVDGSGDVAAGRLQEEGQGAGQGAGQGTEITVGAARTELYFPMLEGKRVAVVGNHSSLVGDSHLVDVLLDAGIDLVKVFGPEHGFRGTAADGERIESAYDPDTGLPIISLYGANLRPTKEQLSDVDIIVFDIQDVGVRFYTYISTMTYIMEEAARYGIPVVVLDRPNPLRHYVDGPLLEPAHVSFVGLHSVPVVYGMTIGEYALMVNGEGWLENGLVSDLTVIPLEGFHGGSRYRLPVPPSPNLPNMRSVYLYPSLCYFERTDISLGRGTDKPFQVYGHPTFDPEVFTYRFTPRSVQASINPPQLGNECHGRDLSAIPLKELKEKSQIDLSYLLDAYHHFPDKERFFLGSFERLSGTVRLREQIIAGWTEEQIRASWQEGLASFLPIRAKYLIYPDAD